MNANRAAHGEAAPEDAGDALARTVELLALATSGRWCSVALYRRGAGVDESDCLSEPLGERQSSNILRMVDELCTGAAIDLSQLDAIAFDAGPGSFTGLRVGCAVAQGLGLALDRPLLAVDSLQALAWQRLRTASHRDAIVLVANDARMDELYVAAYRVHDEPARDAGPGHDVFSPPVVEPLVEPCLIGVGRFVDEIDARLRDRGAPIDPAAVLFAGDAWQALQLGRRWADRFGVRVAAAPAPDEVYVHADAIAELAHTRWVAGGAIDASAAAPRYLRDKVALDRDEQRELRARRDARSQP